MLFSLILFFTLRSSLLLLLSSSSPLPSSSLLSCHIIISLHFKLTHLFGFRRNSHCIFSLNSCFVFPSLCRSFSRTIPYDCTICSLRSRVTSQNGTENVYLTHTHTSDKTTCNTAVTRFKIPLRYISYRRLLSLSFFFHSIPLNSWMCSFHDGAAAPYYDVCMHECVPANKTHV